MVRVATFILLVLMIVSSMSAQVNVTIGTSNLHGGKIGLGIDGFNDWPNFLVKYFVNNQLALEGIVGVEMYLPGGDTPSGQTKQNGVTLRGGLSALFHFTQNQMTPYLGVVAIYTRQQEGGFYTFAPESKRSVVAGVVAGGEYFANDKFSLGLKQLLGAEFSFARHENSQAYPEEPAETRFKTSTIFTGRYYFN